MALTSSGYAGKTIMPREIAEVARAQGWFDHELTKAIATALAESKGSLGAWHDNYESDGTTLRSRDCGLYQINIPASKVGTDYENNLRTDSMDEEVWRPVLVANVERARALYDTRWTGNRKRRWQPWVAYTTGWATFPEWWVWRHDADKQPVGPWVKTGRYLMKAIAGQVNYRIFNEDWTSETGLDFARKLAAHFGVTQGELYIGNNLLIGWRKLPPIPTEPPTDGRGPRPVPNDGV